MTPETAEKDTSTPPPPFGAHKPSGFAGFWLKLCHAMPTRKLALWMRRPIKRSFGQWVDLELWGLRLRLAPKGNLTEQRLIFMPAFHDTRENAFLAKTLGNGDVFLDIGANAGAYSLFAAARCPKNVRIESFEPDPELCRRLRFNLRENHITNVFLHEIALGRESGEMILKQGEGNRGQNEVVSSGEGRRVPVKTLASVLAERNIPAVAVLKIDVEGHEPEVLEPFFQTAHRSLWPAWIICESFENDPNDGGASLLLATGYSLHSRTRMNGIFRLEHRIPA